MNPYWFNRLTDQTTAFFLTRVKVESRSNKIVKFASYEVVRVVRRHGVSNERSRTICLPESRWCIEQYSRGTAVVNSSTENNAFFLSFRRTIDRLFSISIRATPISSREIKSPFTIFTYDTHDTDRLFQRFNGWKRPSTYNECLAINERRVKIINFLS